jgi:alpha-glucosidase
MGTPSSDRSISSAPTLPAFSSPGRVQRIERTDDGAALTLDRATLRLRFLDEGVLEVRFTPAGATPPGFSYALDPDAGWDGPGELAVDQNGDTLTLSTSRLVATISQEGQLMVATTGGRPLLDSATPDFRPAAGDDRACVGLSARLEAGERLFGLGDKAVGLDRRGHHFELWNTDAFGFERGSDPLYKSIPFLLSLRGADDLVAYGLFVDTFARSTFDVGHGRADRLRIESEDEELVFYVLHAETPVAVLQQYARLTGRLPMLPRWALGYHQCRYSYCDEDDIRQVARELRTRRIPCDTLYFDIHYMDGYRVFTWDREAFPDPEGLIADLHADGFTTVAIIGPGIKAGDHQYEVLRQGIERDAFVRYPGGTLFEGDVWPGVCHFPDFTDPGVRHWWGDLQTRLLEAGIDGIWCDMNEPAVFTQEGSEHDAATFPDEVLHRGDGHPMDHRRVHNAYGSLMLRATYEGLRRLRPDRRPFTITRAAYAGVQRFGTTWTGDNSATWEQFRLSVEQCVSLNLSGVPFCGADVGGFSKHASGELLARWTQAGALIPLFRNHSAEDTTRQEPWRFGARVERVCREAIELRYRLLPYLYTVLRETVATGAPMLRPLPLIHPAEAAASDDSILGFYVGVSLLAYPVMEKGLKQLSVWLPSDSGWYDFHSGRALDGGQTHVVATTLDVLPLFVRGGTVLPLGPVVASTAELTDQPLMLRVYPCPGTFSSMLYEDAGDGREHEAGDHFLCTFHGLLESGRLAIETSIEGRFEPAWRHWNIEVYGMDGESAVVRVNGAETSGHFTDGVLRFQAPVGSSFDVTTAA